MKDEISLKSIFEIIKNRIVLILCVTLLTTVGTAVVTKFYITPEYTSSLKLCVVSNAADMVSSSSAANDRNMILYAKDMISTCIEALNAGDAYADVTNRLREMNGAYGSVKINSSNVRIAQVDNSAVLKIVVTTSDPQLAYDTCQAFEQMAIERVPSVGAVKITKLDSPVLAAKPSSPSLVKNCVLGAMIGFVLCSAIVILIAMLDNTVKDPSETAKQLNILLLSEIPDLFSAADGEKYYAYQAGSSERRQKNGSR